MKRLGLAASLLGLSLIGAEYRSAVADESTRSKGGPAAPAIGPPRPAEELESAAGRARGPLPALGE